MGNALPTLSAAPYTKIKMIEFALSSDDKGTFLHDNSKQDLDDIIIRGNVKHSA